MSEVRPMSFDKRQHALARDTKGGRLVGLTVRNPNGGYVAVTGIVSDLDADAIFAAFRAALLAQKKDYQRGEGWMTTT